MIIAKLVEGNFEQKLEFGNSGISGYPEIQEIPDKTYKELENSRAQRAEIVRSEKYALKEKYSLVEIRIWEVVLQA